jgi:hypothetical protein
MSFASQGPEQCLHREGASWRAQLQNTTRTPVMSPVPRAQVALPTLAGPGPLYTSQLPSPFSPVESPTASVCGSDASVFPFDHGPLPGSSPTAAAGLVSGFNALSSRGVPGCTYGRHHHAGLACLLACLTGSWAVEGFSIPSRNLVAVRQRRPCS